MRPALRYQIKELDDHPLLLVTVSGVISAHNVSAMTEEVRTVSNETRKDILYDLIKADLQMTFAEIFYELNHSPLHERKKVASRVRRIAGVISQEALDKWGFVEDVHQNTGYNNRIFVCYDEAVHWLCRT